jgi:flagellin-like hook-associated protein FlgL
MSGINRISTFAQQTQNLLNLLRNEQSLNDVLLQQSTGNKAPTYAGIGNQAGQLLNIDSLQNQAQGFLDNINSASTRLNLTDTALKGIGSLATNFQQELQQLQSSPTPPNISDLARTTLQQLASLLDSSDGSQFLFSGSQLSAAPVTSLNTTRIPTKTLGLAGNLDTNGIVPANTNGIPPVAGSFTDVSLSGPNAVMDSSGHQYDTTVRFVHQSAGPPNQWQAYLVSMTRSDDPSQSATFNGQPISQTNPVAIGKPFDPSVVAPLAPFNQVGNGTPGNTLQFSSTAIAGVPQIGLPPGGGTITVNVDANQITNAASASAFTQVDNATKANRIVLNQLNLDPSTPVGDTATVTLNGTSALFATGATAGHDKLNATITLTKTQAKDPVGGLDGALTPAVPPATRPTATVIPLAVQGAGYNPATTIVTFTPPPPGGTAPTAVANVNGAGQVVSITITSAGSGYFDPPPPVATITDTSGAGAGAIAPPMSVRYETWQATLTSLTDASTGAGVTLQPITPATPYVIGTIISDQHPVLQLGNIKIGAPASGTKDANGTTFEMATNATGTLNSPTGIDLQAGAITSTATGSTISPATVNPLPPIGTPQVIELSGNLSSATPVNISVANATSGSFADISFQNAQAVVDSSGAAHNLTIRLVKVVQQGSTTKVPAIVPAKDLYQAYAIGMTAVESGKDSTVPPVSASNPMLIGAPFDPTAAAGTTLTFSPTLTDSASLSVTIPITPSTFSTSGGNITLTNPLNTTTVASTKPNGQLTMTGNLSTSGSPTTTGILQAVNIVNGGKNFAVNDTVTFNTPPGGTAAQIKVTAVNGTGAITAFTIVTAGSGYTSPPIIAGTSGVGTGEVLQATTGPSAGGVGQVTITAGGAGYHPGLTTVAFPAPTAPAPAGGGVTATGTVQVNAAGQVTGITITNPGYGYVTPPALVPVITDAGAPPGAGATATVQLGPSVNDLTNAIGSLSTPIGTVIASTAAGANYFQATTSVSFPAPPNGGIQAAGTVTVGAGGVTSITITNPGSGYTTPPVPTITATGGINAAATSTLAAGVVTSAAVTNGGAGYHAGTIVTFPPPPNGGTTAIGTVTIVAGVITAVNITSGGSGYVTPPVPVITDPGPFGTGATFAAVALSPETPNNTFDLTFAGTQALRDSSGNAYEATVRVQNNTVGSTTGWRAYLTSLTDPATGKPVATGTPLPMQIGQPPFDVFSAQDAALGAITIPSNGPQSLTIPGLGTSLALSIPINSESFTSNVGASSLTVGGQSTTSLSAGITDTTYFNPGGSIFDTSQAQLQLRTATDSVVKFGVRADNPAFEQFFRVLNFFKDQSVPANATEVGNANQLTNSVIAGINALRANVANTQAVLKNEQNFHQTTINLAKDNHDKILTVDSATTAMNLNALSNLLQESFATLGTIKNLSLVNFLK